MQRLLVLVIVGWISLHVSVTTCQAQVYGESSSVRGFKNFRGGVGVGSSTLSTFRAYSSGITGDPHVARTAPNPLSYSNRTPVSPVAKTSHNRSMRIGLPIGRTQNKRIGGKMPSLSALASQNPTISPFASLAGITSVVEQSQQTSGSLANWRNWALTSLAKPIAISNSLLAANKSRLRQSASIFSRPSLGETSGQLRQTTSTFARPNLGLGQTRLISQKL